MDLPEVWGKLSLEGCLRPTARGINKGGGRGFFGGGDLLLSSFRRGKLSTGTELSDSFLWTMVLVLLFAWSTETSTEWFLVEPEALSFLDESGDARADVEFAAIVDSDFIAEQFSDPAFPLTATVKESFGRSEEATRGLGVGLVVAVDLAMVEVEFGVFLKKIPDLDLETGVP